MQQNNINERKRVKFTNFLLLFCTIIFSLVIGEIAVRYFRPASIEHLVGDSILIYKIIPGSDYDERGFRNPKALTTASIVAIGDSQTFGNQAQSHESWSAQLGIMMTTSVYNMAVPGYGAVQYNYLFDQAMTLNPQTIIVGFYFGNDLFDAYHLPYEKDPTGYWRSLAPTTTREYFARLNLPPFPYDTVTPKTEHDRLHDDTTGIRRLRVFLRDYVQLYALLGDATRGLRERIGMVKPHKEELYDQFHAWAKANPTISYELSANGIDTIFTTAYRASVLDYSDPRIEEGLRITKQLFLEMQEKANNKGVRLVIAFIPTKETVYSEYIKSKQIVVSDTYEHLTTNEAYLNSLLLNYCVKHAIECVDLTPELSQNILEGKRLFPRTNDGHYIASGYRVIAQLLHAYLSGGEVDYITFFYDELNRPHDN